MGCRRSRRGSDFLGIKEDGCYGEPRHFGGFGFSELLLRSESMFPLVCEVVRLLTTTEVLQMRGGADTDEKMGHEQDASPNPRAMCYNFQLSAHCQVCRHQLLRMCGAVAGMVGRGRTRSFRNKR